jgi:hypothetical protein
MPRLTSAKNPLLIKSTARTAEITTVIAFQKVSFPNIQIRRAKNNCTKQETETKERKGKYKTGVSSEEVAHHLLTPVATGISAKAQLV